MTMSEPPKAPRPSFLGTGWSFPPEFPSQAGQVLMVSDEEDIKGSLKILVATAVGERFLQPKYGLDMSELLFDPMSTTMLTYVKDRARTAILFYEPRINLLSLELDTSRQHEGEVRILLDYEIRTTNSRYNLVHPFYTSDGNEARRALGIAGG
jgi:Bacteriophage baseplate protein W